MANKEKKGFSAGAYAGIAGVIVAALLVVLTIFAFTTRYTAFSPEKTAQYFVDVVVQNGDGYNSYKNTLVSKNQKFGDFVINAYMTPYVNKDAEKNELIGTGSKEEAEMLNKVYDTMYDYYLELVAGKGMDDYDTVFSSYFAKLSEVRKAVIGDEYMDTEFMFGVFESNVDRYSKSLTGSKVEYEADGKTVKTEATIGKYQEVFGEDYKLTTAVESVTPVDDVEGYVAEYKTRISTVVDTAEAKADAFGLENTTKEKKILFIKKTEDVNTKDNFINAYAKLDCADAIEDVAQCVVAVSAGEGSEVAKINVYVVKIGNSWYVDNTNVDTSPLFLAE